MHLLCVSSSGYECALDYWTFDVFSCRWIEILEETEINCGLITIWSLVWPWKIDRKVFCYRSNIHRHDSVPSKTPIFVPWRNASFVRVKVCTTSPIEKRSVCPSREDERSMQSGGVIKERDNMILLPPRDYIENIETELSMCTLFICIINLSPSMRANIMSFWIIYFAMFLSMLN